MTVLYYDGDCPMCHRLVIWLLERDKNKILHFAAIQSDTAKIRLNSNYDALVEMDTVILETPSNTYTHSTAALKAIALIPSWKLPAKLLMLFPTYLRDPIYRLVARNRHRIWNSCPLIPAEYRDRFI
jgi:predicted DCC family thiol-disulfide oxidoreductase YuxK